MLARVVKVSDHKHVEATGDLIGNKMANKITGTSKGPQQNNSETVTNEHYEQVPKERYISPKERQKSSWQTEIKIV